jgi:hypothetical protein
VGVKKRPVKIIEDYLDEAEKEAAKQAAAQKHLCNGRGYVHNGDFKMARVCYFGRANQRLEAFGSCGGCHEGYGAQASPLVCSAESFLMPVTIALNLMNLATSEDC